MLRDSLIVLLWRWRLSSSTEQQGVQSVICCHTETKIALLLAFKVGFVYHGSTLILDCVFTDEVENRRFANHYFDG